MNFYPVREVQMIDQKLFYLLQYQLKKDRGMYLIALLMNTKMWV